MGVCLLFGSLFCGVVSNRRFTLTNSPITIIAKKYFEKVCIVWEIICTFVWLIP